MTQATHFPCPPGITGINGSKYQEITQHTTTHHTLELIWSSISDSLDSTKHETAKNRLSEFLNKNNGERDRAAAFIELRKLFPEHNRGTFEISATDKGVRFSIQGFPTLSHQVSKDITLTTKQLAFLDLSGAYLVGVNLEGANMEYVKMERANLAGANMRNADMWKAHLEEADMRNANLAGAEMWNARMNKTNMARAYMKQTKMVGAYMAGIKMEEADMEGANVAGADMRNAHMKNANMKDVHMVMSYMTGANMEGVGLSTTDGKWPVNMDRVNLTGAKLKRGSFRLAPGMNLRGCDLTNVTITLPQVVFDGPGPRTDWGRMLAEERVLWALGCSDNKFSGSSMLTAIASIDSRFDPLKVDLMCRLIQQLNRANSSTFDGAVTDVLQQEPFCHNPLVKEFLEKKVGTVTTIKIKL